MNTDMKRLEAHYQRVTITMKDEFCNSDFYKDLSSMLTHLNDQYVTDTHFELLDLSKCLVMDTKEFDKMLEKCYRKDVLYNKHWEDTDETWTESYEWAHPTNCFEKLNDTLRTKVLIRYLDGVDIILKAFAEISKKHGHDFTIDYKAEERGYYGVHFVVEFPFEVESLGDAIGTKKTLTNVEIQICTQISEVVNELLHEYYERQRLEIPSPDRKWQWDYDSDEFAPAYLGHITHYVEGVIMQSRQKAS